MLRRIGSGFQTLLQLCPTVQPIKIKVGMKVNYLRIWDCDIEPRVLSAALQAMPNIVDLGLHSMAFWGDPLRNLAKDINNRPPLPRLKHLRMLSCGGLHSDEGLEALIQQRNIRAAGVKVARIETLVLKWCGIVYRRRVKDWLYEHVENVILEEHGRNILMESSDDDESQDSNGIYTDDDMDWDTP
ncbi:hypothetical protein FRC03_008094 [Tulasnella sp. 419]|nr:hypothetical protein FRC03_008094 [Tulasnella sp. 419]